MTILWENIIITLVVLLLILAVIGFVIGFVAVKVFKAFSKK
ncbi:uncharacterized protein YneF (UPF0154 family) [Paenibacillus lactis]|uniref:Uncharacterized protein n=2 Tax=Paenibacillus lactis TaxID=228574 RepID=G4HBR3_9BACL|nr:hypothetical protein PaelaDRAFT_1596 [Paenibacillus lactis 154]MBP1894627.1 uncharacterized protein YneF (UPF0154 family) [Paenibacillus lactis]